MSMISKQIDDLRAYAKDRKGELAKLVSDAADTIEMLSAELSAANMERSARYCHGGWIPCSERSPEEEEKSYWVCLDGGGQCQCRWTNNMYGLGANKWDKWGWHVMDKPQYSRVIAWMPLPEPYREEQE